MGAKGESNGLQIVTNGQNNNLHSANVDLRRTGDRASPIQPSNTVISTTKESNVEKNILDASLRDRSRQCGLPALELAEPVNEQAHQPDLQALPDRDGGIRGGVCVAALKANAPAGISAGKSNVAKQNQQITRTEWFRYELDFRKTRKGFNATIRKRLKWSNTRYSKQIIKKFCPQLTRRMIDQISVGKFSPATIAALLNGGITDGFIRDLQGRIGKGNGKRRADLTDYERSLLARIESGLGAGGRSRNA